MNKVFKVKRNSRGQSVVCSEIAKSHSVIASTAKTAVAAAVLSALTAVPNLASAAVTEGTQTGSRALAVGAGSAASGTNATAVGTDSKATGADTTAIGRGAIAGTNTVNATAIGSGANAPAKHALAIGGKTLASNEGSIAIGFGSEATGQEAVAIGGSNWNASVASRAIGDQSIAIGPNTKARGHSSVVIGNDDVVKAYETKLSDKSNLTITRPNGSIYTITSGKAGNTDVTVADAYTALTGQDARTREYIDATSTHGAVTVGVRSQGLGELSTALGTSATVTAGSVAGVALGAGSTVDIGNGVAIGAGSTTKEATGVKEISHTLFGKVYEFAGGQNTDAGDVVSFGSKNYERQLKNVAAGKITATSTDGINGSQLYAVIKGFDRLQYLSVNSTIGSEFLLTDAETIYDTDTAEEKTRKRNIIKDKLVKQTQSNIDNKGALGNNSIAIGPNARTTGKLLVGDNAGILNEVNTTVLYNDGGDVADDAVALGSNSTVSKANGTAIGSSANVTVAGGVALGNGSVASIDKGVEGAKPFDEGRTNKYASLTGTALTSTLAAVSVGNGATATRQITGVAAGTKDTDAVNVAQLKSVNLKIAGNSGTGDVRLTDQTLTVDGNASYITSNANNNKITFDLSDAAKKKLEKDVVVAEGKNVTVTNATEGNTTTYTVNAWDTTVSNGSNAVTVTPNNNDSEKTRAYTVDLSEETKTQLKKEETVVAKTGETNIVVNQKTTKNATGGTEFEVSLNKDVNLTENGSLTVGPVNITKNGIDAGNQKITNVADPAADGDAVNLKTLKEKELHIKEGSYALTADGTVELTYVDGNDKDVTGKKVTLTGFNAEKVVAKTDADNIATVGTKSTKAAGDIGETYEVSVSKNAVKDAARDAVIVKSGKNSKVTPTKDETNHTTTYVVDTDFTPVIDSNPFEYVNNEGKPVVKATDGNYYPADQLDENGAPIENATGKTEPKDLVVHAKGDEAKPLTNIASNLPNTTNGDKTDPAKPVEPTKSQALPDDFDITKQGNNAATVADVLNAGWNLKGNNKEVDFVKPYDTVNFVDGKNTTVTVSTDDNKTSKVKVDVNDQLTLGTKAADGNDGQDGKLSVQGKDGKDGVTLAAKDGEGTIGLNGKDGASADFKVIKGKDGVDGKPANGEADKKDRLAYTPKNPDGTPVMKDGQPVVEEVATLNDGLRFTGNNEVENKHKLNTLVKVVGQGVDKTASEKFTGTDGNINVTADGTDKLTIALSKDLNNIDSVNLVDYKEVTNPDGTKSQVIDDKAPKTTLNNEGIEITPVAEDGSELPNQSVSLTKDGLNNGDNNITNVKGNLAPAYNAGDNEVDTNTTKPADTTAAAPTKSVEAPKPADVKKMYNNAATVGDVLNAGFNLKENSVEKDFVKPYDTVNFVNGVGTIASVVTDAAGKVSDVAFNIDKATVEAENGKIKEPISADELAKLDKAVKDAKAEKDALAPAASEEDKQAAEKKLADALDALNKAAKPDQVVTADQLANAVNNTGWYTNVNGENGNVLVKPGDKVFFEAGKNLTLTPTFKDGETTYSYALADTISFGQPVDSQGQPLTKVDDKYYPANKVVDGKPVAGTDPVEPAKTEVTLGKDGLDNGGNTITNVGSDLPTYNDADKPTNGLVNLNPKGENNQPSVSDSNAATVGDLRKMGWVVSSDKTTGNLGTAYNDKVQNADEVKFVGTNLATVSGKTEGGVRTITVDVDAQKTAEKAQLPVVYTDAKGNKLTKEGDKFYRVNENGDKIDNAGNPINITNEMSPEDQAKELAKSEVKPADVIASLNNGDNATTKTPTSLANVKGNLNPTYNAGDTTINDDTQPNTENKTADAPTKSEKAPDATKLADIYNNAATVGDVLNAGWNLKENDTAKDFVKPYDTVGFVDGTGTLANVTVSEDGKTSNVTFNIDKAEVKTQDGKIVEPVPADKLANLNEAVKDAEKAKEELANNPDATEEMKKAADENLANAQKALNDAKKAGDQVVTAQELANAVNNTGWKTNVVGDNKLAEDVLVKPGDKVEFAAGDNLDVAVKSDNGTTTYTYKLKDKITFGGPADKEGNPLTKANDGKYYPQDQVDEQGNPKVVNGTPATPVEPATTEVTLGKDGLDNGGNTISNVTSGLDTYPEPTPAPDADPNAPAPKDPKAGLVNLNNDNVPDSNAATVGDLRKMGWVVSSDKTTGDLGTAYNDKVQNADEVKFVGTNLATVSGKTDDKGVRTITVDVDAQKVAEAAQTPVVYTDAEGNKLTKEGDKFYRVKDGKKVDAEGNPINITDNMTPEEKAKELAKSEVKNGDVIASLNNGNNDSANVPTSLSNVKGNLAPTYNAGDNTVDGTTNKPTDIAAAAPTKSQAAPDAANVSKIYNNAATVGDVLNAGWNLQGNDEGVDFVKPYDTVNFVDGKGTVANVTTNGDGTVSIVTFNIDKAEVKTADGKITAPVDPKELTKLGDAVKAAEKAKNDLPQDATEDQKKAADENLANAQKALNDANKLGDQVVTAQELANAVNNTGWKTNAVGTNKRDEDVLVKPGDKVEFAADNNLNVNIKSDNGTTTYTYGLNDQVTLGKAGTDGKPGTDGKLTVKDAAGKDGVSLTAKDGQGAIGLNGKDGANANITVAKAEGDITDPTNKTAKDRIQYTSNVIKPVLGEDGQPVLDDNGQPKTETVSVTESVATLNDGLAFTGNNETLNKHKLNTVVTIKGEGVDKAKSANFTSAAGNINVKADGNSTLEIQLAKDVNLGKDGSVTTGKTKVDDNGVTITPVDAEGKPVTDTNKVVSLTDKGLNNGGNQIKNVAAGTAGTDGVNVSQLNAVKDSFPFETVDNPNAVKVGDKYYDKNDIDPATDKPKAGAKPINGTVIHAKGDTPQTINNVASNLPETRNEKDGDKAVTKSQAAPSNVGDIANNAATVADVLNAGFNLKGNGDAVDFVKPYDTLDVVNGKNTTVTVSTTDNKTSTIKVDVNDQITLGKPSEIKDGKPVDGTGTDGKLTVQGKDGKDGVTIAAKDGEGVIGLNGKDGANANITVGNGPANLAGQEPSRIKYTSTKPVLDKDGKPVLENGQPKTETVTESVATLNDGLKFAGDNGETVIDKKLNEKLEIVGGADKDKLSDKNIGVNAKDGKLEVKLAKELKDLTSAEFKDGDVTTKVDGKGITITPATTPAKAPVSLTKDGLNNGDNNITNVKGNLAPTYNAGDKTEVNGKPTGTASTEPTAAQSAPTNVANIYNNAATVGDVLNAGFNLQGNGEAKDFVKPYDTVNFVDGTGTVANVTTSADGKTSNVTFNIDKADVGVDADGKLVDNARNHQVQNLTHSKENLDLALADLAKANENGTPAEIAAAKEKVDAAQKAVAKDEKSLADYDKAAPNKVVTLPSLVEQFKQTGWKTNAVGDNKLTEDVLVKPSDKVEFAAGDNLDVNVKSENGTTTYTYSLKDEVTFKKDPNNPDTTDVTLSNAGLNNGGNKITHVAAGAINANSTDAVNGSQLQAAYNYFGDNINQINGRINDLDNDFRAAMAGAHAAASLPEVRGLGKSRVSVGLGQYRNQSAVAVGYSRLSDNGKYALKTHISTDTQNNFGGGIGLGYEW
ncbi:YadA-like family protein [Moraxella marmotae]|uniref:YadA-like family protein n=1 Tax=Moraxella marmotae TaxID=3344520 RepID=UPI0035F4C002